MAAEIDQDVLQEARTLWDYHLLTPGERCVDVAIALGSHDLRVAERAADIMQAGRAPLLVVTGGAGKVTHDLWSESEAEAFKRTAIARGVPAGRIVIEPAATNTTDNIVFTRRLLGERGISVAHGAVVCKPYMARRAMAVATRQWPEVSWSVDYPRLAFEEYPTEDVPLERMIQLMVGDLQRIDVYASRGFQTPQEIPDAVWAAYHALVRAGFDQFVIRDED